MQRIAQVIELVRLSFMLAETHHRRQAKPQCATVRATALANVPSPRARLAIAAAPKADALGGTEVAGAPQSCAGARNRVVTHKRGDRWSVLCADQGRRRACPSVGLGPVSASSGCLSRFRSLLCPVYAAQFLDMQTAAPCCWCEHRRTVGPRAYQAVPWPQIAP